MPSEPDFLRATRESYNTVAATYAERFYHELDSFTVDRALLAAFAEFVNRAGSGQVLDVGCGPGRTTALLDSLGVPVWGLDLSEEMVRLARERHPGLRFEVGSMTDLPVEDESLGGLLAYYSLIHVPTPQVSGVLGGFARALRPGAPVAVAFQAGRQAREFREAHGHPVELVNHRRTPDQLGQMLQDAGFELLATTVQPPKPDQLSSQAFVIAQRRPAA